MADSLGNIRLWRPKTENCEICYQNIINENILIVNSSSAWYYRAGFATPYKKKGEPMFSSVASVTAHAAQVRAQQPADNQILGWLLCAVIIILLVFWVASRNE